jgi:uncharacterized protein
MSITPTQIMPVSLTLTLLPQPFAVCQLPAGSAVPAWAVRASTFSITRTADELSIVCDEAAVPPDAELAASTKIVRDWRAFKFEGPFDFALTGIMLAVLKPLADAGVGVFTLSTYDTDYVLVKAAQLQPAITALARADHTVREPAQQMLVKFGWRLPNNKRFEAHFDATIQGYEAEQDRWIATLARIAWITPELPANVRERVDALRGQWVRIPNEARMGMTLPLKFETLAGRVKFFYPDDPRLAASAAAQTDEATDETPHA